eukprot:CAMPEP_0179033736 /NCGR_PEP_ID=MMETSP0796-20121207/12253_1 /TAXON_ID=73915 /ORGANISM="Pyrodinium bahamense, Strain pbaha01" /LENGTH=136 /DNA_ID=CAMNT_0020729995 /DNA_START=46 /DNA_END=457 /DNA_ORIENTATION=-
MAVLVRHANADGKGFWAASPPPVPPPEGVCATTRQQSLGMNTLTDPQRVLAAQDHAALQCCNGLLHAFDVRVLQKPYMRPRLLDAPRMCDEAVKSADVLQFQPIHIPRYVLNSDGQVPSRHSESLKLASSSSSSST